MLAIESKTAPYFASLQIDWTEEMVYVDIHVVSSESSKEDDDDQFFEEKPPQDNKDFIVKN